MEQYNFELTLDNTKLNLNSTIHWIAILVPDLNEQQEFNLMVSGEAKTFASVAKLSDTKVFCPGKGF